MVLLVLGGPETQLMTFFGPSMTKKIMVEARARKISGSFRLRWVVMARVMRVSVVRTRVCVRHWL